MKLIDRPDIVASMTLYIVKESTITHLTVYRKKVWNKNEHDVVYVIVITHESNYIQVKLICKVAHVENGRV